MVWIDHVVKVHQGPCSRVLPGDKLLLYHNSQGLDPEEEWVIVTRVLDDHTVAVAKPTWWRRAYWWLVRLIWRWWRRP